MTFVAHIVNNGDYSYRVRSFVLLMRMCILFLFVLVSTTASAQSQSVIITEPSIYMIGSLFKKADTVAVVKVLSGDTENYESAVYKGEVTQSFKGARRGEIIYFGPFIGQRLGSEYVLFLRNVPKPVTPKKTAAVSYGTIDYSEIFDEGYSSMEISYTCGFKGKDVMQKCDDGVRVCTDYIKLPKSFSAFSLENDDPPFGCKWARKTAFLSLLGSLKSVKN